MIGIWLRSGISIGAKGLDALGVDVEHGAVKEAGQAEADHVDRGADDDLIGLDRDGEEGEEQADEQAHDDRGDAGPRRGCRRSVPAAKPANAPKSMMPSSPMLSTPDRSVNSSPTDV